ncbi:unnamed protein product [Polarella glacialis]|uniref:Uncharacterized protein n=1 Tax=Polarella glacialis TaxID=89957 RepID=A0A813LAL9_POLGL|nr:unnamed protein product [Polarella glacialis]
MQMPRSLPSVTPPRSLPLSGSGVPSKRIPSSSSARERGSLSQEESACPEPQQGFRRWAWTVADDVIALRREFEDFRNTASVLGCSSGTVTDGETDMDVTRTAEQRLSASSSYGGDIGMREAAFVDGPSPSRGPPAAPALSMAGSLTSTARTTELGRLPAMTDEGCTPQRALEFEQAVRRELKDLRFRLENQTAVNGRDDGVELRTSSLFTTRAAESFVENEGGSGDNGLSARPSDKARDSDLQDDAAALSRLQAVEAAVLDLGRELLSLAEVHRKSDYEQQRLAHYQEDLEASLKARMGILEESQHKADSSITRVQSLLSAQTQGTRGLSEDLSCVVEELETRLRAMWQRLDAQDQRLEAVMEARPTGNTMGDRGPHECQPLIEATVSAPQNQNPIAQEPCADPSASPRTGVCGLEARGPEAVEAALRANPRRQRSEAARLFRALAAWAEAVRLGGALEAQPQLGARGGGSTNIVAAMVPSLEQELQHRLACMEQTALLSARCEVLRQREEICSAVHAELQGADQHAQSDRYVNAADVAAIAEGVEECKQQLQVTLPQMSEELGRLQVQFEVGRSEVEQRQHVQLMEHVSQDARLQRELSELSEVVQLQAQQLSQVQGAIEALSSQLSLEEQEQEQVQSNFAQAPPDEAPCDEVTLNSLAQVCDVLRGEWQQAESWSRELYSECGALQAESGRLRSKLSASMQVEETATKAESAEVLSLREEWCELISTRAAWHSGGDKFQHEEHHMAKIGEEEVPKEHESHKVQSEYGFDNAKLQLLSTAVDELRELVLDWHDMGAARKQPHELSQPHLAELTSATEQGKDHAASKAAGKDLSRSLEESQEAPGFGTTPGGVLENAVDRAEVQSSAATEYNDDTENQAVAQSQHLVIAGVIAGGSQCSEHVDFMAEIRELSRGLEDLRAVVLEQNEDTVSKSEAEALSLRLEQLRDVIGEIRSGELVSEDATARAEIRILSGCLEELQAETNGNTCLNTQLLEDAVARAEVQTLAAGFSELREMVIQREANHPVISQGAVRDGKEIAVVGSIDLSLAAKVQELSRGLEDLQVEILEQKVNTVSKAELEALSLRLGQLCEVVKEVPSREVSEDVAARAEIRILSRSLEELQEATRRFGSTGVEVLEDSTVGADVQTLATGLNVLRTSVDALILTCSEQERCSQTGEIKAEAQSTQLRELADAMHLVRAHELALQDVPVKSEVEALSRDVAELREAYRPHPPAIFQGRPATSERHQLMNPTATPPSTPASPSTPATQRRQFETHADRDRLGGMLCQQPGEAPETMTVIRSLSSEVEQQAEHLTAMRTELKVLTIEARQCRNQGVKASTELSQALMSFEEQRSEEAESCEELRGELKQLQLQAQLASATLAGALEEQQGQAAWFRARLSEAATSASSLIPVVPAREIHNQVASLREELSGNQRDVTAGTASHQGRAVASEPAHREPLCEVGEGAPTVEEVLSLHFPTAPWPAPPGFEETLSLRLRSLSSHAAYQVSLRLLPSNADGLVVEACGPNTALEELQQLPLLEIEVHGCRCGLVWRSFRATSGKIAAARPSVHDARGLVAPSGSPSNDRETLATESFGTTTHRSHVQESADQSSLSRRFVWRGTDLEVEDLDLGASAQEDLVLRGVPDATENFHFHQESQQYEAPERQRQDLRLLGQQLADEVRQEQQQWSADWQHMAAEMGVQREEQWSEEWHHMAAEMRVQREEMEAVGAERQLCLMLQQEASAEETAASVALAVQEEALALAEQARQERGELALASRAALEEWRSGLSELRTALAVRSWELDENLSAAPKPSNIEALASREVDMSFELSTFQAMAQTQAEQIARLQGSLVEVRGSLSVELWEARQHLSEELAAQAALSAQLIEGSEAQAAAELEGVRNELAEAVEDSIELRQQLLALCRAKEAEATIAQCSSCGGSSEVPARNATQPSNSNVQLSLSQLLDELQGSVGKRFKEAMGSVGKVKVRVDVLAARQEAAEQNASRGIALLQQAVQALSEQQDLRRKL